MENADKARWAMRDSCLSCQTISAPVSWERSGISVKAVYRCPACGYCWPCWWAAAALPEIYFEASKEGI